MWYESGSVTSRWLFKGYYLCRWKMREVVGLRGLVAELQIGLKQIDSINPVCGQ